MSHRREDLRGVPIIAMPPTTSGEALSSRAHGRSKEVLSSAPLVPKIGKHSTFEPRITRPAAHEVSLRPTHALRPIVRMTCAREEASSFSLRRMMHDSRRVRLANFHKWVKKSNGSSDPYDHMASFMQVARAE